MKFEKFTRRPYDVNAVQVTPDNAEEVAKWCGGTVVLGDYKHSRFTIQLPIVKVPGNGVNKGKQVDARIGSWIIEYKGNFRVYREKQIHEDFYQEWLDGPKFEAGHLVEVIETSHPKFGQQGTIEAVGMAGVVFADNDGYVFDEPELKRIEEFSEETKKQIAAQVLAAQDPIQKLRDEAEAAVMRGDLNVHEALTEAFEDSQVIENIGDIKIGTVIRVVDEMNDFFGETGEVESFVNDNCLAVKMDLTHGGTVLDPVNHLVREVEIEEQTQWARVKNQSSGQFGWIGWIVRDTVDADLVRIAFRSAVEGSRDKCFSYMPDEVEKISKVTDFIQVPVYDI